MVENLRQYDTKDRLSQDDIDILYRTSKEINAKTILEIGSENGISSIVLGMVAKENNGHLYCIEPRPRQEWYRNIKQFNLINHVTLIQGYSPWIDRNLLPSNFDYLFIDGEHKTRWCIVDYHYWSKFVRKGGRIAFHDIYGPCGPKVNRALNIILEDAKLKEIAKGEKAKNKGTIVYETL